jgi:hypothetical protein
MVYLEKFVAVLVSNGKILRELRESDSDLIRLPFGSEYSLRFKNLNSTRAAIAVEIDGKDVLDGSRVVIGPGQTEDLLGFMKGNNVTNTFRFIEKTKEISEYRGDRIDDGIIRIEYQFEKPPAITYPAPVPYYRPYPIPAPYHSWPTWRPHYYDYEKDSSQIKYGSNSGSFNHKDDGEVYTKGSLRSGPTGSCVSQNVIKSLSLSEEGITVKGSQADQNFSNTWLEEMEEAKYVIVFRLKGCDSKKKPLTKAVTIQNHITCPTCGRRNNSASRFCYNCGTCLI